MPLGQSAAQIKKISQAPRRRFGGSDHESFYNKGIPVLFAFTGTARRLSRLATTPDRIN